MESVKSVRSSNFLHSPHLEGPTELRNRKLPPSLTTSLDSEIHTYPGPIPRITGCGHRVLY